MSIKSEYRKTLAIRGFQMLVIGIIFNFGITIIGLLAFIQFFWMIIKKEKNNFIADLGCLLYTSPSPRDNGRSRMPSSA